MIENDEPKYTPVLDVLRAIKAVQAELAVCGIAKNRENAQQHYKFRGIDDVYAALAPLLDKHNLVIVPSYSERIITERKTSAGGALFSVCLRGQFGLTSTIDGSSATATTYGEAMDSADKATNKAMSAAYKAMCFQVFCVPTEGDNDADATTPVVEPRKVLAAKPKPAQETDQALIDDEIPIAPVAAAREDGGKVAKQYGIGTNISEAKGSRIFKRALVSGAAHGLQKEQCYMAIDQACDEYEIPSVDLLHWKQYDAFVTRVEELCGGAA